MAAQRHYRVDVFGQDGVTFIAPLTTGSPEDGSVHVKNAPSFSSRINGGLGELVLDLACPFDDFDEGGTVDFMNVVRVYAVTVDDARRTQAERLVYTGFVSRYEPYLEPDRQGVKVTCLGVVSLLTRSYYKDGDFTVAHAAQDPTAIAKAVVDHFNTVYGGDLITYDSDSIPAAVGAAVSVTFTDAKWFDALRKAAELAGEGWFWFVGADGRLVFKEKPANATHLFTVGRDVASLALTKDSEAVVNDVYVRRGGGAETHYEDAGSQADYGTGSPSSGKSTLIVSDPSLADAAAADQRADKELGDNSSAKVKGTVTINTAFDDLESIRVGDTCRLLNYDDGLALPDNMLIAGLTYDGDTVTLELEEQANDLGLALQEFVGG